jgi:hypothetical protein
MIDRQVQIGAEKLTPPSNYLLKQLMLRFSIDSLCWSPSIDILNIDDASYHDYVPALQSQVLEP